MKAIETIYNGYRFRSRLEARWAVFFDTLGIEYRYEDEGYDLDGVWYLPDFYLPQYNYFIEIKPDTPTREEREKAIKLCQMKRCRVLILFGDVWKDVNCHAFEPLKMKFIEDIDTDRHQVYPITTDEWIITGIRSSVPLILYMDIGIIWTPVYWTICDACQRIDLTGPHSPACCNECLVRLDSPRLLAAYTAARQARFEHGESPC